MVHRRVCIVGPGAIGGMLAVRLERAGYVVSALARPAKAAAIAAHGIHLLDDGKAFHGKPRAESDPAALGTQDLVVVTLKGPALHEVAPQLEALCGPATPIVFVMNGVPWWFFDGFGGPLAGTRLKTLDPDGTLARLIPNRRIIWGVIDCPVTVLPDGSLSHYGITRVILGRPDDSPAGMQDVADVFAAAGYTAIVSPAIRQDIWNKLLQNLAMNSISALTGAATVAVMSDPLLRDLIFAVGDEGRALGLKLGLAATVDLRERYKTPPPPSAPGGKTSMLQDLERGRPLETDSIVAVVGEIAALVGLPAPLAKAFHALLQARARTAQA